ncbi:protein SRC2 isoform X1 [Gastrolobium bilobum]|uniref:protein SRC2 isoform X1 n=1 Tax=Gastrolobium bilobum TaxID=150636 RepID=UPI002AB23821|nr:protein SRC2 isoform X1 [Gastrolobium bilobum]
MGSRYEVEVKLTSARGLKNVNWRNGANRPYVVVWVDPSNKLSTRVDENGDTEANWDQTLVIPLPPKPLEDMTLYIDVVHAGSEKDTKPLIGSARLRLVEVLDDVGFGERASRTLTLKRPSGRPHGKVDVKVTIRDPGYRAQGGGGYYAPPYGVPPPPAASSRDFGSAPPAYGYGYGAAPPQSSYGYGAAPPAGYPSTAAPAYGSGYGGYNAPQQTASYGQGSYGYAPVEEKKKSKFGGMGTGLAVGAVAGVLGGIALVEGAEYVENKIADDAAEKVEDDLRYDDGGYDDGGYGGDDF